jgi:hypothetical protein|eukprot:COSAG01_NODE_886_length_12921_cov_115.252652_8_plen_63_part_00
MPSSLIQQADACCANAVAVSLLCDGLECTWQFPVGIVTLAGGTDEGQPYRLCVISAATGVLN